MSEPSTCRLSVVVASYNRASFLPGCVESLRQAGVPDMEIVIVDDGSRDNTREMVRGLGPSITYIYQENRGLSAARNTGILAARGRYLAYLDSDDYWLPGVAPQLLEFLDRHPDVGAVFTDAKVGNPRDGYTSWIQDGGKQVFLDLPASQVETGFRVLETLPFYRGLLHWNFIFTGAIIQRRELVIEAGLFEPELKATGDWELWMRMIHRTRFAYCPETLAIYTRHDDNMTNDQDRMRQAFCDTLRVHAGRGLPLANAERNLLRKTRKDQAFDYGYKAYDRGDYAMASRRFGSALSEHGFETRTAVYWALTALPGPLPRWIRALKRSLTGGSKA
jgi:glycosyltransferase involved in cell wall biosynthesis